ncbi:aluminum activated malate transporter family protein [Perilla frutescens var. hirtella]|uniref:Aluminum activated malate transporter family protein n=1 Tax=Perilla frutescens var. hirtella TaxID=608512 RepID=A0AAD4J5Q2_PERFH|nr:aluminum activated malate transporter family protein [Perilla frutescens var. hirtella]
MERVGGWFKARLEKMKNAISGVGKEAKRLGKEDPRRVVHSLKVGFAIAAVSLFYYFDFSFDGFGVNAMWAVMTVVVVFEFSVGATLGKGVNRAIATLLGGALGVGMHDLVGFTGEEKIEVVLLGLSVFLIAAMATFCRFFPKLRARYDYGVLIFILTFSLISVSGYRADVVFDMAYRRLTTILIGGAAAILVCIFICPVWAGQDLHKLTASNIDKLGTFLEAFGHAYFQESIDKNQASLKDYKTVLNSKGVEDPLVNFAKWEPRHGKFKYRHPWEQYLKIGSVTRECAYKIDALNCYLNSEVQTPLELRTKLQESCTKITSECSSALTELAIGVRTMTCSSSTEIHIVNAKSAAKNLKALLQTGLWPDTDFLHIIPAVTVASLLIELVSCTVKIADSVEKLATMAKFNKPDPKMNRQTSLQKVKRIPSIEVSHNFSIVVD